MSKAHFRPYSIADRDACLSLFDANCPTFFAPNERADYADFLDGAMDGYEVCEIEGQVVGAFGLFIDEGDVVSLNWILLDPASQGLGVGSSMMERVVAVARSSRLDLINIAASHKSARFFEKFGATATTRIENGWGPGMDRIDMELRL